MSATYHLNNEQLAIRIRHTGAELASLTDCQSGLEYMWQADPEIWNSHAPVLFPIIGSLKDGYYTYEGKKYKLPKHGFIRHAEDLNFSTGYDCISCRLEANERTRVYYPFEFEFELTYRLQGRALIQEHRISNLESERSLPFSLGGHPAFKLPLRTAEKYEDYQLRFEHFETAPSYQVTEDGLIAHEIRQGLHGWSLSLQHDLFHQDALVLRNHRSRKIAISHKDRGQTLAVSFRGWPYLGIWAKPEGDFVCIEPWLGLSDTVETNGNILDKEGILLLPPGDTFRADFIIEVA